MAVPAKTGFVGPMGLTDQGWDVSDICQEVDEEVRREQLKKLWDRYQTLIVAVAILILAAVAGWRGYEYWIAKKSAESGAAFEAAAMLAAQGNHTEADAAFAKI